jgi:radical SAM protein with 4Fe4S-binding SPASM domain
VEISLYGATQETYERVTGVPGSYARCMRGIDLLQERGLPLQLKSVLITLNQHELEEMQRFAQNMGVNFRFDPVINAGIDGSLHPTHYRLSPEQIVAIETSDPGRFAQWPQEFIDCREVEINTTQMYTCGAGKLAFHIDAFGKLCLCISARTPNYDLRKGTFREGWEQFLPGMRLQEYSQSFACFGCELRPVCAQCPAMAISEFGNFESRVPFLCKLAHLRQQAFDPLKIEPNDKLEI